MARVIETATLPPEKQKLFYSPWLAVTKNGWAAGVSTREAAKSIARELSKKGL